MFCSFWLGAVDQSENENGTRHVHHFYMSNKYQKGSKGSDTKTAAKSHECDIFYSALAVYHTTVIIINDIYWYST